MSAAEGPGKVLLLFLAIEKEDDNTTGLVAQS